MSDSQLHSTKAEDYKVLRLNSDAFADNETIPSKYTCDGIDVNPSIHIGNLPETAKSLAIIVDDPDAPGGSFTHWVIWNIPLTHHIKEGHKHGEEGLNDFRQHQYNGPCPPSGTHRYYFKVYALDSALDLAKTSGKRQLEDAMIDHILAFGILTGKYSRNK